MRILILGKNGQVGRALQRVLPAYGEVIAIGSGIEGSLCGDLTQVEALRATIRELAPHIIVNAGAYTAVDKAENEPELAMKINGLAPKVLAEEAKLLNALLIHYSTDYVFDGLANHPLQEMDTPSPQNTYGHTKLVGERAIQETYHNYLIFRTCWVYADQGSNFIRTMLRLAHERDTLNVIDDQIGSPTSANLIARITGKAIQHWQQKRDFSGIYHLSARGQTSWCAYARFILTCAANENTPLKVNAEQVNAIPSEAYPTPAKRPKYSLLDSTKLETDLGIILPDWHDEVKQACINILRQA